GYGKMNRVRAEKFTAAKARGYALARYVSTKAATWPDLTLGENSFVMEANVIQPFAAIGDDTILWCGNHIGHHTRIGNHCFLASPIVVRAGVEVGAGCFTGATAPRREGTRAPPRGLTAAAPPTPRAPRPDEVSAPAATTASRVPSSRIAP